MTNHALDVLLKRVERLEKQMSDQIIIGFQAASAMERLIDKLFEKGILEDKTEDK